MYNAITALCGKSSLKERLANAGLALISLRDNDLSGDINSELRYLLHWTRDNLDGGEVKAVPGDVEYSKLVEKMLSMRGEALGS
jgi:hypothetical protein